MILSIGKPARFEENGLPIRGQCQPYSHEWQLKFIDKGKTTILFEGTYYICRQLQIECKDITDIEALKTKIEEITLEYLDDTQETAVISQSPIKDTGNFSEEQTSTISIPKNEMEKISKQNSEPDES